jgi:hypothetical protein
MPPHSSPIAAFIEPAPSFSLPFIIFNHADTLIRMTSDGFIDLSRLGPLYGQHHAHAVLSQFNVGKLHLLSHSLQLLHLTLLKAWLLPALQASTEASSALQQRSGFNCVYGLRCTTAAVGISPSTVCRAVCSFIRL